LGLSVQNDFPVFVPSMAIGEPDRIYGIPVYVNNDIAEISTGAKSIICGDMSKFIVRSCGNPVVERIDEQYKSAGITAFRAKVRKDSHLLNSQAVKHLIQA
jgi:HK97 family phage major capsid protein